MREVARRQADPVLEVKNLSVWYRTGRGSAHVLRDLTLSLVSGEIVGVVGESGCGKSTLAKAILRLLPHNGQIDEGQILLRNRDVAQMQERELRHIRGNSIAMIFQDPSASLNPGFRISTQMADVALAHGSGRRRETRDSAVAMLERVGIADARNRIRSFPFEFSGGMQQRVAVAMALMKRPDILLADEPTSALDVTLQAQVIDLIGGLAHEYHTAVLLISHDFRVVKRVCDRIVVMYGGRVVEEGTVEEICERPLHPYTQALLKSRPSAMQRGRRLAVIPGRVPDLRNVSPGCEFTDRCASAKEICGVVDPQLIRASTRSVRCHLYDDAKDQGTVNEIRRQSEAAW